MVKKMVRLALGCEYQRRPIRRADISEKVLGTGGTRRFKEVFNQAQVQLRAVFGMEMVELPAREKTTLAQRRGNATRAWMFEYAGADNT
jgi:melanoma-associated antigen